MVIPREAKRITYSSEIRALKEKKFSKEQLSIITGALLGDGCLHVSWSGNTYRFSKTHSVKQIEYANWTYEKLQPFVLTKPTLYKPVQSLKIRTISHPELTALRAIFYPQGTKVLPSTIESIIRDPLALAVWFMDDGNVMATYGSTHGYHLNTQSFTRIENERIAELLRIVWKLRCTVQKNKGKYRIYIWSRSKSAFVQIVREFLLPSMQYKLG